MAGRFKNAADCDARNIHYLDPNASWFHKSLESCFEALQTHFLSIHTLQAAEVQLQLTRLMLQSGMIFLCRNCPQIGGVSVGRRHDEAKLCWRAGGRCIAGGCQCHWPGF